MKCVTYSQIIMMSLPVLQTGARIPAAPDGRL